MTHKEIVFKALSDRPISNKELCEITGLGTHSVGCVLASFQRKDIAFCIGNEKRPGGKGIRWLYVKNPEFTGIKKGGIT